YGAYRFVYQSDPNVASSQTINFTQITETGNATDAAISPDGKYMAYVDGGTKQQSLWVKQLGTGSVLQIVPPAEVEYLGLTFSNNGVYIYYVAEMVEANDASDVLYRVPSMGGPSKKLLEKIDSCVTFSPDGQRFAFVRFDNAKKETSLMIANA